MQGDTMTVACNHNEYGHDAKQALADYLNANGIAATNTNTGGGCMAVEVYRNATDRTNTDAEYLCLLDSDEYADDGTPCGTFTVIRATVDGGEEIALVDTAMPAVEVLAYVRAWLVGAHVTVTQYADALEVIVRNTIAGQPDRYNTVRSWGTLHDACDANDLLADADNVTGIADVFEPWAPEYVALTTGAIAIVAARVWGAR